MDPISVHEFLGEHYTALLAVERNEYMYLRISPAILPTDLLLDCELNNGSATVNHYVTTNSASLFTIDIETTPENLKGATQELFKNIGQLVSLLNAVEQCEWGAI